MINVFFSEIIKILSLAPVTIEWTLLALVAQKGPADLDYHWYKQSPVGRFASNY